mmetsp:Transcript_30641/g.74655  ORF Transcript_30641/g.74655 Transcript_30641/m.74655 type:complete len:126 (-) Transcript_30641:624-1001(-)
MGTSKFHERWEELCHRWDYPLVPSSVKQTKFPSDRLVICIFGKRNVEICQSQATLASFVVLVGECTISLDRGEIKRCVFDSEADLSSAFSPESKNHRRTHSFALGPTKTVWLNVLAPAERQQGSS